VFHNLIKIKCLLHPCVFCVDTLTSNDITCEWRHDITCEVTSVSIFSTDQSTMRLLNLLVSKPSMQTKELSDWPIHLTVWHMLRQSKVNECLQKRSCSMLVHRHLKRMLHKSILIRLLCSLFVLLLHSSF